jgi:chloramphenicol-sensitive protein RarD
MNKGFWYGLGAYFIWGFFPIYWKWLHGVPALQILGHRIVWSFGLLALALLALRQWRLFRSEVSGPGIVRVYLLAAVLLGVNWLIYVWAVNAGYVVESSLGYFINPLVNVLLGVLVLRERLRRGQWLAVGLAAAGVVYLTIAYGAPPWIALSLALSFGLYGLVTKKAPLNALHGLTLETGLLCAPLVIYLALMESNGQGAFLHSDLTTTFLLMGAGIVTVVPLLMFNAAVRLIPLSMIGILQYVAPTLQFLVGVLIYREPFTPTLLAGFSLVWAALILFTAESFWARRQAAVKLAETRVLAKNE